MNTFAVVRSGLRVRSLPRDATQVADLLQVVLVGCALASIAGFLITALFRLGYPYPLQEIEQATLDQVQRILRGQPLYVAPTLEHVPLIYGPVSYYLAAVVGLIAGQTYLAPRLVSLLASIGSLTLLVYLIRYETGSLMLGVLGAGLLAETFPLDQTALDLGRVDALFAFWLLAAVTVARTRTSTWALAGSGILVGLAGLTKLPTAAAPVILALAIYLGATVRRRTLAFLGGMALTVGVALLALRLQSGPWPAYYLWTLPQQHVVNDHGDLLGRFWFLDILPRFTFPLLLGPAFLLLAARAGRVRPLLLYGLVGVSLIGLSWASRSNSGGATNVLLPTHMLLALLFGLGIAAARRELGRGSAGGRMVLAYVLGLCVVQFGLNAYNPRLLVPYRSEQWAAERISSALASLPGELFAPDLNGYLAGTDRVEQPHLGALAELFSSYGGDMTEEGLRWQNEFGAALRQRRYAHVVINEPCCELLKLLNDNGYVATGPLFPPGDDYWLWTTGRSPSGLQVFVPR